MDDRRMGSLMRRCLLAAGTLLLLASCLAGLLTVRGPSTATRAERLAEAESRWLSQAVTHYRMVLHAPSWCRLDVEIRNERVVKVYENSCPSAPRTVTSLFELIKQLDSHADAIFCAPRGCECTEVRFVQAVYDEQLGFPRAIRLRRQRETNWPELWHFFVRHGLPNCLTPLDLDVVDVVSLKQIS
jgi:hypothetical protein